MKETEISLDGLRDYKYNGVEGLVEGLVVFLPSLSRRTKNRTQRARVPLYFNWRRNSRFSGATPPINSAPAVWSQ